MDELMMKLLRSTGWAINNTPIKNLNIAVRARATGFIFLPIIETCTKFNHSLAGFLPVGPDFFLVFACFFEKKWPLKCFLSYIKHILLKSKANSVNKYASKYSLNSTVIVVYLIYCISSLWSHVIFSKIISNNCFTL